MSRGSYERLPVYAVPDSRPRLRSSPSTSRTPSFIHSRSRSPSKSSNFSLRPRSLLTILKFALPSTLLVLLVGFYLYEPHIELAFYNRKWVSQEIDTIAPLSGCFDASRVSAKYNVSEGVYGQRRTEVQAGMALRTGLECYAFAGTIKSPNHDDEFSIALQIPGDERTQYHTYWRNDLAPFGPRQEWMLKSFFATQNVRTTRLVLWSNGDLSSNEILRTYAKRYPDAFALKIVDIPMLARGTELEGSPMLNTKDSKAWVDGDLIRLLLLWNYGGVWIDMDSLLVRDLEPLLEHEFVTQWDCYGASSYILTCPPLLTLLQTKSTSPSTAHSCASASTRPTSVKPST